MKQDENQDKPEGELPEVEPITQADVDRWNAMYEELDKKFKGDKDKQADTKE